MKLFIDRDFLNVSEPPSIYLCDTSKRIIGELPAYNRRGTFKWNTYSELSFDIPRLYVDMITGETKVHPLYDKVESPRNVYLKNYAYFSIQDVDDTSNDSDVKSVTAFSLEYATSHKYLTNWRINTGEVDSKEVLYNEAQHGIDYNTDTDSFYELAHGDFNAYKQYYVKQQTETSYIYEPVAVRNAEEYDRYINDTSDNEYAKLYMKKFPNVQFYNRKDEGLSLLHLVLAGAPEWTIGNVDSTLWRMERTFNNDRISIYDFLMNDVADAFGCVFEWDTLTHQLHVYEEENNFGIDGGEIKDRWDTDVYISKENLASECKVSYSSDDIKTKLVVTGADDLDIREVNLGRNEIMDLSFYHTEEWMEDDLFEAYSKYLGALNEAQTGLTSLNLPSHTYPTSYPAATNGWVSAYNRYNDMVNQIPVDTNVVLVGDKFKKLYCTYSPIQTNETNENPSGSLEANKFALIKKLNQYDVDKDTGANNQDNILLRLKNSSSDVATIRIYDKRKLATEYDERLRYYTKNQDGKFSSVPITITDANDFKDKVDDFAEKGTEIWTNDYHIQSVIVKASTGVSEDPDKYPIINWIEGTLTAQTMGLKDYTVTYIGTMGAYFVLAKDEAKTENLQDYGIRMLEEKHKIYTKIFQTQTEYMFSNEKLQCIAQDEQPEGDYKEGTRWLDTNSSPIILKEYNGDTWEIINENVPYEDEEGYNKYQRYIDNYEKLMAVQSVLQAKKRDAEYCKDGYMVSDRVIVSMPTDGSSLNDNMYSAALKHFNTPVAVYDTFEELQKVVPSSDTKDVYAVGDDLYLWNNSRKQWAKGSHSITRMSFKSFYPLYTFTTSFDPSGNVYAVYLKGTTPYVSYENSQGVYQMIREYIRNKTEIDQFLNSEQLTRLSPFIKEDEFRDSNFLLTGYESEEERLSISNELMEAADKELQKLCKPSLKFSMTMANILALPEFEDLFDHFQLGNFIRVEIRDGYVKRSRLLEVDINFDELNDFSCTFGDLITAKSEVDKHADLLAQSVTTSKQVAKSASSWQKAVDKTNVLEDELSNGLSDMTLSVGSASGQAITWDSTGMHFRKYRNGSKTEFEPEEMAIINNALVATNDSWKTSKAAFGKYKIGDEERWGPIAEYVTADVIEGKLIRGGAIEIGTEKNKFIVNEDGSVEIRSGDTNYVDAIKVIGDTYRFTVVIGYQGLTIFSDTSHTCTITCEVYDYTTPITADIIANETEAGKDVFSDTFKWVRRSNDPDADADWKPTYVDNKPNQIVVSVGDVIKNSQFYCEVDFDATKFKTEETEDETEETDSEQQEE